MTSSTLVAPKTDVDDTMTTERLRETMIAAENTTTKTTENVGRGKSPERSATEETTLATKGALSQAELLLRL